MDSTVSNIGARIWMYVNGRIEEEAAKRRPHLLPPAPKSAKRAILAPRLKLELQLGCNYCSGAVVASLHFFFFFFWPNARAPLLRARFRTKLQNAFGIDPYIDHVFFLLRFDHI